MSSITELRGPIGISLTNDYLFHALLQENNFVLKSLICDLLHLDIYLVSDVKLTNPIKYGKHYDSKTTIFDVKATMADDTVINLEMQVVNWEDWPDRSLTYLCRGYDNLNKGEEYTNTKSVYQISLLDFTLFPEQPKFYSIYQLREKDSGLLFSSKFQMIVVDLNHVELATEEDKSHHIDQWARFFKASNWEDITMISKENPAIHEAASTVLELTADEEFRLECEARDDYIRRQNFILHKQERLEKELAEKDAEIAALKAKLAELTK